jgi:hypothetical protein
MVKGTDGYRLREVIKTVKNMMKYIQFHPIEFRQKLCQKCAEHKILSCKQASKQKVKVTLRPTTSRSVRLGFEPHLGLMTRY